MTGIFTVLCIQRNDTISDVLSIAMHNSRMYTISVSDMEKAADMYVKERPDAIVMDFKPGSDEDYSFISKIRSSDLSIPIIAVSMENRAKADAAIREMCVSCITQPFTVTEIIRQLEEVRDCTETDTLC